MKKLLVLVLIGAVAYFGWQYYERKQQEKLGPPAIQYAARELSPLVNPDGMVNLNYLARLLPAPGQVVRLRPYDREAASEQLTAHLDGHGVWGTVTSPEIRSKGAVYFCEGNLDGMPRFQVQWYVLKSQAEGLATRSQHQVFAPLDEVTLLADGRLRLKLERPAGR